MRRFSGTDFLVFPREHGLIYKEFANEDPEQDDVDLRDGRRPRIAVQRGRQRKLRKTIDSAGATAVCKYTAQPVSGMSTSVRSAASSMPATA